jgi:hypothetical protein
MARRLARGPVKPAPFPAIGREIRRVPPHAIITAVEAEEPPLRLLPVARALKIARERLEALRVSFDAWADTTLRADFHGESTT